MNQYVTVYKYVLFTEQNDNMSKIREQNVQAMMKRAEIFKKYKNEKDQWEQRQAEMQKEIEILKKKEKNYLDDPIGVSFLRRLFLSPMTFPFVYRGPYAALTRIGEAAKFV